MLIELLLALLIFTVSASGLLGLQLSAMRASEDASRFTRSALLAMNALEKLSVMHALDSSAAPRFSWNSAVPGSTRNTTPVPIPGLQLEQMAENEVSQVTVSWLSLTNGVQSPPTDEGTRSGTAPSTTVFTLQRWRAG
jgi:Tfp pilus assembly protein PilV